MKRFSVMLAALGALFVCAGCSDGPKDVAVKWSQSIMHGDAPDAALYSVSELQTTNQKLVAITHPKLKSEAEKTVEMQRRIADAITVLKAAKQDPSLAAVVRCVLTDLTDDEEPVKKKAATIQKQIGETIAKLKKTQATVNGDIATIVPEKEMPFVLRKVDGAWKVEKPSMTAFAEKKAEPKAAEAAKNAAAKADAAVKDAGAKVDAAAKDAKAKADAVVKDAAAKVDAAGLKK